MAIDECLATGRLNEIQQDIDRGGLASPLAPSKQKISPGWIA